MQEKLLLLSAIRTNIKQQLDMAETFHGEHYAASSFENVSPLKDNDDELNTIWKNQYSLQEFLAPTNFKSYDELKKRLDDVLSGTVTASAAAMMDEDVVETPVMKSEPAPSIPSVEASEEEDTMSYFQKLANG